jgi:small-conductance mechanosensitive channel
MTQQATPNRIASPQTIAAPPAAESDQSQWSFRREMEALAQAFSLGKILLSLLILLLGYSANKLVALLVTRAGGGRNIYAEWLRRLTPFVSFTLWFVVVLVIVQIFAESLLALVLLITVAALALAFASQPLLRDLVGGLVILFEHPFRLGDRITVGEHHGEVKEIGLRAFQLAPPDGSLVAVPNATVLDHPIVNANPGTTDSRVTIELLPPDECDLERAQRIAFEAAAVSPYACIHKPIEVYLDEQYQNDLRARIIIQAYVFDARYERRLRSDTVERARRGFQSLGRVNSRAQNSRR